MNLGVGVDIENWKFPIFWLGPVIAKSKIPNFVDFAGFLDMILKSLFENSFGKPDGPF